MIARAQRAPSPQLCTSCCAVGQPKLRAAADARGFQAQRRPILQQPELAPASPMAAGWREPVLQGQAGLSASSLDNQGAGNAGASGCHRQTQLALFPQEYPAKCQGEPLTGCSIARAGDDGSLRAGAVARHGHAVSNWRLAGDGGVVQPAGWCHQQGGVEGGQAMRESRQLHKRNQIDEGSRLLVPPGSRLDM